MECISTKEKKEALKMLKARIVEHIDQGGPIVDNPYDTCSYCPVNNDSMYYCFDAKTIRKFDEIRASLVRKNLYSHNCKLNFDTLRILFGNKVIDLEPRTLCRQDGDPENWFSDEYLRFIELFKYLKISFLAFCHPIWRSSLQ